MSEEIEENVKKTKPEKNNNSKKEKITYSNIQIMMQGKISDKVTLGDTLNPYEDAQRSTAIDSTVSNYNDAKEKAQKIRDLICTGRYDKDLAKYIPGLLELTFQSMLEDIDTGEKTDHPSYTDMEQLDFQILLTKNYYVNRNGIHICFPIKIKKGTNKASNIDADLITVNDFFAHWVKEVSITKYGCDKELHPTFSPYAVYQYADSMLKHYPKIYLKPLKKLIYIVKSPFIIMKLLWTVETITEQV